MGPAQVGQLVSDRARNGARTGLIPRSMSFMLSLSSPVLPTSKVTVSAAHVREGTGVLCATYRAGERGVEGG